MSTNVKAIEMETYNGKEEHFETSKYDITRATHPGVCFFHIFFKFCAFFSYLFLGMIISSTLFQYILIMIFHALDFYTVKSITGRFLVGLRWYSDYTPKGKEVWRFESFDLSQRSKIDSTIFWSFQVGASGAWAFFVFANVMSFGIVDIIFAGVGASLSWINLWGFYKSSKDQQKKMKNVKGYLAKKGLLMAMKV